jgi:hypothetical protein
LWRGAPRSVDPPWRCAIAKPGLAWCLMGIRARPGRARRSARRGAAGRATRRRKRAACTDRATVVRARRAYLKALLLVCSVCARPARAPSLRGVKWSLSLFGECAGGDRGHFSSNHERVFDDDLSTDGKILRLAGLEASTCTQTRIHPAAPGHSTGGTPPSHESQRALTAFPLRLA